MLSSRPSTKRDGFTIVELLMVVAIIGLLASMLVPLFLDALQRAKQKRTMTEINMIGVAGMSWITDNVSAAAAGQPVLVDVSSFGAPIPYTNMRDRLIPQYLQEMNEIDAWENPYEFRFNTDLQADNILLIRSPGFDGTFDGTSYTSGAFEPSDYDQDIVWTDGFFVRWPS